MSGAAGSSCPTEPSDQASAGEDEGGSSQVAVKNTQSSSQLRPGSQYCFFLPQNADLNLAPPNWLRTNSPAALLLQSQFSAYRSDTEPSSVVLASHYPDFVGEMDVIADAKIIKKLLKMPYCSSDLSMAIHRIGKTLLLDNFSSTYTTEASHSTDVSILEKLIEEGRIHELLARRKKDPAVTRHRNMFSKLLYYSANRAMLPVSEQPHEDVQPSDIHPYCPSEQVATSHAEGEVSSRDIVASDMFIPPIPAESVVSARDDANDDRLDEEPIGSYDSVRVKTLATASVTGSNKNQVESLALLPLVVPVHHYTTGSPLDTRSDQQASGPIQERIVIGLQAGEADDDIETGLFPGVPPPSSCGRGSPSGREDEDLLAFPCPPPEPVPLPFQHNVHWNIEDIQMLLGSDLPIFGKNRHPAISLRLRDMQKPITVLTGLDYWLDNLMCNVPELAMCFHLNGIVQRYEIIKTEDIPNLEACQFPPQEVLEVAQNILAFLKSNCTKEGHTYWLFRRKGEDVVKLYDLTSLNSYEDGGSELQNPFARSVAILFYKVGQSMLNSDGPLSGEDLAMVRLLLENCIKLLGENNTSQIVVSAYYQLAALFISMAPSSSSSQETQHQGEGGTSDEDPCEVNEGLGSESEERSAISAIYSKSLSVSTLRQGPQSFPKDPSHPLPPLVLGSSQDRARAALEYISKGLSKLNTTELQRLSPVSWQANSGTHLLQQAGSAYLMLAEAAMGLGKLGRSLRYTRYSILCTSASQTCSTVPSTEAATVLRSAWQLTGDIHCLSTKQMSDSFSSHFEDFHLEKPEDSIVIATALTIYCPRQGEKEEACLTLHTDLENSLLKSIDCYELAQQLLPSPSPTGEQQKSIHERLGNTWNELGVYYMHVAASLDFRKEQKQVEKLWTSSYSCLMDGLRRFQLTNNSSNQALLYANLGSLMSACARAHGTEEPRTEFSPQEKLYYNKAAEFYIKGKESLKRRPAHPGVWSSLVVDLSGVYLTLGRLMQERAPLSTLTQQEVEREIVEVLMKALQQTEPELPHTDPSNQRFVLLSQRAGDCHYRLASLYQKSAFASASSAQKQKHSRTQAEKHYSKALHFYQPKHHTREILRTLLEKALLYEQQAQGKQPLKHLQSALSCLLECSKPLREYSCPAEGETIEPLIIILIHRLQVVLKLMVAFYLKKSDSVHLRGSYKSMYALALRTSSQMAHEKLPPSVSDTLDSITALYNQMNA